MSQLWDRQRVDRAKRGAWEFAPGALALPRGTSPADGLQAAREVLGQAATFRTINASTGFPIYSARADR